MHSARPVSRFSHFQPTRSKRSKRSPMLNMKLSQKKYETWQSFLDNAYWSVELK